MFWVLWPNQRVHLYGFDLGNSWIVVSGRPHKYSNTNLCVWFKCLLSPPSVRPCSLCACWCLVRHRLHAVVGFVGGGEARQTHTLVGAHHVDALGVFTQRHPIVELWTLVHICGQRRREKVEDFNSYSFLFSLGVAAPLLKAVNVDYSTHYFDY